MKFRLSLVKELPSYPLRFCKELFKVRKPASLPQEPQNTQTHSFFVTTDGQLVDSRRIRAWATIRPFRNLAFLALDWICVLAVQLGTIFAIRSLDAWDFSRLWVIPIGAIAVILNGCLIHRIGLMGHEASHHMLVPNRRWNDLLANLFCFFPVWSTIKSYRAKHLGHHLHPNDPNHDPNLAGGKAERLFDRFPMPKPSFIYQYYAKFFWPPFVLRNLIDLFNVLTVGPEETERRGFLRSKTALGLAYLLGLTAVIYSSEFVADRSGMHWLVVALPAAAYLIAVTVWAKQKDGRTLTGFFRFTFYTILFGVISLVRHFTGFDPAPWYLMFWILPLMYVFPYLMLLREVYQHANLGAGRLNNSRIIHADLFTRWAVLGYGNDYHLIHHLYPNIPHYNLREAHSEMMLESEVYRENAEEAMGTFQAPEGESSLVDQLTKNSSERVRGRRPALTDL